MRHRTDNKIDELIVPPRRIYRHAAIRLVGLTHIERLTETRLRPTGAAAGEKVLAERLRSSAA